MNRRLWAVVAGAAVIACEQATETSSGVGAVALQVVAGEGGAAALDSGRVIVSGPTNRTVRADPGQQVTIDELAPGSYTVSLQGFVGDEVDHFGRATGVQVVAGQNTTATVTFTPFRPVVGPVTLNGDATEYLISFAAVPNAVSYRIETDHDASFPDPRVVQGSNNGATFTIDIFGPLFVRVRGLDPFNAVGVASDVRAVTLARFGSTAGLDGAVDNNGGFTSLTAVMGDADMVSNGLTARQLYSFDLSGLPPGAAVTSAVVRLFQADLTPGIYADHGNVLVDHVDFGDAIDGTDFEGGTLESKFGILSSDETIEHKAIDVTGQVGADLTAGRTRSQFRLLFETESDLDGVNDLAVFGDQEQSCFPPFTCAQNDQPELRLVHE